MKNDFVWKYLDWDSTILERRVARITFLKRDGDIQERRELIKKLVESFKKENIVYATYRLKASDFITIHALEAEQFRLVDGYLCLMKNLIDSYLENFPNIRQATREDETKLTRLSGGAFASTRFYNDPFIKKRQADKIYSEWIKNSLHGKMADLVFVWEERKVILGFITIKRSGNIVLIAVDHKRRGRGIGKGLIKMAINQFMKWGLKESTIETQMTNISALRAYQSCGYNIIDSYLTFRWSANEN